jgi:hypothetical protein
VAVFDQQISGMVTQEALLAKLGRIEKHDA